MHNSTGFNHPFATAWPPKITDQPPEMKLANGRATNRESCWSTWNSESRVALGR